MDSYSSRENMLVGLASQRSLSNKNKVIDNSEMDFNDVFGGPPRRSSVHEMRHSFTESKQYRRRRVDEEEGVEREVSRSPWFAYEGKPVFGEEGSGMVRRKKTSDDFYDDIFRGDESPRVANSLPGSRVLSPARPLPPKADSFASSSIPPFSLPEILNSGIDLPAFASISRSPNRKVDVPSSGTSLPNSCSASPSRFSSPLALSNDEPPSKIQQPYRQSPLSIEFSLGSDGSVEVNKSDKADGKDDEKKLSSSPNILGNSNRFHFSIYKWASKGPSVMVPLKTNDSKIRDNSDEKYLSSRESIKTDIIVTELPADIRSDSAAGDDKYISVQIKEQENKSVEKTSQGTPDVDQFQNEEESTLSVPEPENSDSITSTIKDISSGTSPSKKSIPKKVENEILTSRNGPQNPASKPQSVLEIGVVKKMDDISVTTKVAYKPEKKSLRSWISDNIDRQGDDVKTGDKVKESDSKSSKNSSSSIRADKNTKKQDKSTNKQDGKSSTPDDVATDKANLKGSSVTVGDRGGKNKVKGKVKEFVKIFNQEVPSKPVTGIETRSQRCRRKNMDKVKNEEHPSIYKAEDLSTPEVEQIVSDIFSQEGLSENLEQSSGTETRVPVHSDASSKQADSKSSASYPDGSKDTPGGADDCFEGDFQVKELSNHSHNTLPQNGEVREDFKADDSKIRKWSNGKETNIRSLLSTLQYVLWPESGWKPVALVDIIEGNSVRRAYQKALLCLHPDKLQQKGASPPQKYIAEKVFEILQEAWTHFNSLGSI